MPYVLGIDIGGTTTTAAVCRLAAGGWGMPEVVRLGGRSHAVPSVLHLAADGTLAVGDPVPAAGGGWVARGFSRRIGDDVPMVIGGEPCQPQALTAVLAMWVVERVEAWLGGPADQVVLSHPATWGPYRRSLLRQALAEIGLPRVRLIPEPVVAAESRAVGGEPGGTLAVYSLGGHQFEAVVVRWADGFGFRLLGRAGLADPLGGADLDEALAEHVRTRLGPELRELGAGRQARLAVAGLRQECVRAKERLSTETETEVLVPLPHRQVPVRVTRAELAELARPVLQVTVDTLVRTLDGCGLSAADLDGVLLVGGATRMPLVGQLVGAALGVPVTAEPEPKGRAATGAAVAASKVASSTRPAQRAPARTPREPDPAPLDPPAGSEPEPVPDRESPPRPPVTITPLALNRSAGRRFGLVGGRS